LIKNNKLAFNIFLFLSLFNLIFPPFKSEYDPDKYFFHFIFNPVRSYGSIIDANIDITILIILLLTSIILSFIIQNIFNFIKNRKMK